MVINNSPDLTNLQVAVRWDISGSTPSIYLTNLSTGSGLANCVWAFVATSPSGTYIHQGDITSPDITGSWATHTISDAWPRPFNQIEWSGAAYKFYVIVKDSNGTIYTGGTQTAFICRPYGNTEVSKNFYGVASSNVSVKCQEARIYFEDTTYHSYKGLDGTQAGSTLKVVYPIDETGNLPAPFQIAGYSTALVPISYSSSNYQFLQTDIWDYDLGGDTTVRIKYQTIQTFAVWCNVDLGVLVCEYNRFIDSIENGSCGDVQDAKNKLAIVSPKMTLVLIGMLQPLTGIDVPALIKQIEDVNAFDCNCCQAPTGIIPTTSSIIDGYSFSVNKVCGDISGTVTNDGSNIVFNLQDVSYVVSIANESPSETTAFSFKPSVDGCQKTYALKIDGNQLAFDILNIIQSDSSLVNLFNSIVNGGSSSMLLVDGKCIFTSASSCNYTFDILNVPADTTYAILTGINSQILNFAFNETNLPALQSYLNGLGLGTFTVTNPSSGEVLITSNANTHSLTSLTYNVSSTAYIADMTRTCTGYTPVTAAQAVQSIIDYLCGITDAEIETSQDYEICYIDPTTKTQKSVIISSGAAVSDFISELLARGCDTINYIINLVPTTCTALKNLFPTSTDVVSGSDFVMGTKNGNCAKIYPVEFGTRQLQLGVYNKDFMAALCAAVELCGAGQMCDPFNYFYLTVPYSSPTDDTMDIVVNFDHPTAISYTLRYARVDNTNNPTYITIPSVLSSPYVISGVDDGQYIVGLTPIYADGRKCTEVTQLTPACSAISSFSAVLGGSPTGFVISYSAPASVPKIRVNIAYPNGGSSSQIYTNDGMDIDINPPTSVYGDFSITIQSVCNEDTGFFGAQTAPVILTLNDPNVLSQNYTLTAAYNMSIDSVSGTGIPSLPSTGTNGAQFGHQTGMSGSYSVVISGTIVTTTKLDVIKNGINVGCVAVPSAGTYGIGITATEADDIAIAIDSGSC